MSDDNNRDLQNNEQKKKRRTRKDQQGRNFNCPCGKSYLSYPALYTHIKTKHHGKAPKQNAVLVLKTDNSEENQSNSPFSQIKEQVQKSFALEDAAAYPAPLNTEAVNYIDDILGQYEATKDSKMEDDGLTGKSDSIDHIFGRFLSQIKPRMKAEGFTYLCDLIWRFHQNLVEQKKEQQYCKNNNGAQLPYFFNDLIVRKKVPALHIKPDDSTNFLTFACKVLYSFGAWLFDQKYTSYAVKFNTV